VNKDCKKLMKAKLKLERIAAEIEEVNEELGEFHISGVSVSALEWAVRDINVAIKRRLENPADE